jgi:hypothetical protein
MAGGSHRDRTRAHDRLGSTANLASPALARNNLSNLGVTGFAPDQKCEVFSMPSTRHSSQAIAKTDGVRTTIFPSIGSCNARFGLIAPII